ncbi:ATP-binding protein, partial [Escherichia coli]|nr:ATP-binding protein [Escherichia coli]
SRKTGASGFGLGLNYVLQVVSAHGGMVKVESMEVSFSEFTLQFPLRLKSLLAKMKCAQLFVIQIGFYYFCIQSP